ncbi:Ig-like domain-containing protein [Longimicrobium sp.]|uniref:Ig-like domain-containing protein n=1 Tax=Longimicrobium sp. TaxID=2029185 RepID=UPI002B63448A|nr:Ig-like domain-containing protein [Longimicrobium sp.]HSU14458.1 Ig-like domain-containing protein [Longimicrobium sp.]
MRHGRRWMGAIVLAAMAGACGEGAGTRNGGLSPTAPRLSGATTHVAVSCPVKMDFGASATCAAYGYDSNNVFTNSGVTSWSSSNTSLATITSGGTVTAGSTGGTVTITAVIDGIPGSTTIQIVPPLSVSIGGRSTVRTNAECYFWATPSGGTAPYTYTWSQTWGTGYSDGFDGYYARSSTSYTLYVTVHDANNVTATAAKNVTVSSSAALCPF